MRVGIITFSKGAHPAIRLQKALGRSRPSPQTSPSGEGARTNHPPPVSCGARPSPQPSPSGEGASQIHPPTVCCEARNQRHIRQKSQIKNDHPLVSTQFRLFSRRALTSFVINNYIRNSGFRLGSSQIGRLQVDTFYVKPRRRFWPLAEFAHSSGGSSRSVGHQLGRLPSPTYESGPISLACSRGRWEYVTS